MLIRQRGQSLLQGWRLLLSDYLDHESPSVADAVALTVFFDFCQYEIRRNKNNIGKLAAFTEALTEDVFKSRNGGRGKFFKVSSDIASIKSVRKQKLEVQISSGIIEEDFKVFQDHLHVLREYDQIIFPRQQKNSKYDTTYSLHANTSSTLKVIESQFTLTLSK